MAGRTRWSGAGRARGTRPWVPDVANSICEIHMAWRTGVDF